MEKELNLLDLENCIKTAIDVDAKYIGVLIRTVGNAGDEVIINPRSNFENKLKYYMTAYKEDLVLKSFNGISIVDFKFGDSYQAIETYFDNNIEDKTSEDLHPDLVNNIIDCLSVEDGYDYENIVNLDFVEVNGIRYGIVEFEELDTVDEGKYQFGGYIYAIGLLDEVKGYDIDGETLFYVRQNFSQTGSYYSHQEVNYEAPEVVKRKKIIKEIWY